MVSIWLNLREGSRSLCPSCDQTLLPCWKVWNGVFGRRLVGAAGVLLRGGILFLHVMVGGDGGVVGPKELVGWVDTVTSHRRPDLHSCHTTLHRGWSIVFWHLSKYCDGTLKYLFTTRSFLEPSVHDHVSRFKNFVDKENRKKCAFTFQNMCFQISDIRYRKTCAFTSHFVLGVGGERLSCWFSKILMVSHPRTAESSGIFTTTGRILFYNNWKETFRKLQTYCSEFQQWLIHLNTHNPVSTVPTV
jgi:hypothetical protein